MCHASLNFGKFVGSSGQHCAFDSMLPRMTQLVLLVCQVDVNCGTPIDKSIICGAHRAKNKVLREENPHILKGVLHSHS